jgi:hypothetical protein
VAIAAVSPLRRMQYWLVGAADPPLVPQYVREGHSQVYSVHADARGRPEVRVDGRFRLIRADLPADLQAAPLALKPRAPRMLLIDAPWAALLEAAERRRVLDVDLAGQEAADVEAQLRLPGVRASGTMKLQPLAVDLQDVLSGDRRYELIVMGPFPVGHPHAGHRYSIERLGQVIGLLADGGVACLYVAFSDTPTAALEVLADTAAAAGRRFGMTVEVWGPPLGGGPGPEYVLFAFCRHRLGGVGRSVSSLRRWGELPAPGPGSRIERDGRPLLAAAVWTARRRVRSERFAERSRWLQRRLGESADADRPE